jgi:cell division protein FtsB
LKASIIVFIGVLLASFQYSLWRQRMIAEAVKGAENALKQAKKLKGG